jgi:hypothetical protein
MDTPAGCLLLFSPVNQPEELMPGSVGILAIVETAR